MAGLGFPLPLGRLAALALALMLLAALPLAASGPAAGAADGPAVPAEDGLGVSEETLGTDAPDGLAVSEDAPAADGVLDVSEDAPEMDAPGGPAVSEDAPEADAVDIKPLLGRQDAELSARPADEPLPPPPEPPKKSEEPKKPEKPEKPAKPEKPKKQPKPAPAKKAPAEPLAITLLIDPGALAGLGGARYELAVPPVSKQTGPLVPASTGARPLRLAVSAAPCSLGVCDFYNGRGIPGAGSLVLSRCCVALDLELGVRLARRFRLFYGAGALATVKRRTIIPGAETVWRLLAEGGADLVLPLRGGWELALGLSGGVTLGFNPAPVAPSPALGARLLLERRLGARLSARLGARARVALSGSDDPLRRAAVWFADPLVLALAFDL